MVAAAAVPVAFVAFAAAVPVAFVAFAAAWASASACAAAAAKSWFVNATASSTSRDGGTSTKAADASFMSAGIAAFSWRSWSEKSFSLFAMSSWNLSP